MSTQPAAAGNTEGKFAVHSLVRELSLHPPKYSTLLFPLFFSLPSRPRAAPGSICSVLMGRERAQGIGNQGEGWGLLTGSTHSASHGEVPGSSERWEEPPLPQSSCETPELTATPPPLPPCDRLWGFNSRFSALRKAAIKTSQM